MNDSHGARARLSNFLIFPLIVMVAAAAGCASSRSATQAAAEVPRTAAAAPALEEVQPSPKNVLETAFSQVGTPYRYGGSSPETGFDCSGFVKWVYGQYDISLPRSSGDMLSAGQTVDRRELKPGDLVFFGRRKRITHVGIYTGDNKYIHSPRSGKSIEESPLAARARGEYFAGARRVLSQVDVEAIDEELKRLWAQADQEAGETAATPAPTEIPSSAPAALLSQWLGLKRPEAATAPAENAPEVPTEPTVVDETGLSAALSLLLQASAPPAEQNEAAPTVTAQAAPAATAPSASAEAAIQQPAVQKPAPQAAPATASKSTKATKSRRHKVASGDTLYDLARKYGTSTEALVKANNLGKKSYLKLGQVLIVPL